MKLKTRHPRLHRSNAHPIELSEVEKRVLAHYGNGLDRCEIAETLAISPRSVGHHLTAAKEKLGADSLAQAAVILAKSSIPGSLER